MSTTQEKFEAAVNVIQNLPKDGPYQPSNDMKLRFYSLYKQATEGPCHINKPAFWDVVGRVKWEAWRKLGDMTKEDAMQGYIDGLKEITLQIVETMAYTDKISDFMESVGPFYEMVELPLPKKAASYDDDGELNADDAQKNSGLNNSLDRDGVNGDLGWSEDSSPGYQENGHVPLREGVSDKFYSSNESDDEFSDPLDNDLMTDRDLILDSVNKDSSEYESNGTFVHVNNTQTDDQANEFKQDGNKPAAVNGPLSGVVFRGGGDPTASSSTARLFSGGASQRNTAHSSSGGVGITESSVPARRPMGAGGGRGRGPQGDPRVGDVTEQIAMALSQLQRDMESVLTRLNTLEALTVAHHNMAQGHLINHGSGPVSKVAAKSGVPYWWPFKNMPFRAVAFFIAWPVVYHLIIKLISSSRASRRQR